ncbi:hypothetical protein J422_03738 [Methanocaldococcus villosus KIN24-T80]|uniref:HTH lysR-type domain-containing protein n=1 Tax=Methanocaldococcus villosus KIN24-T80 TaxID=1069083 RepID=N6VQI6_9EURY|nr:LysR family transcriptional regulator [Methanocaldococcus villosus]ENN96140.1 hypothetical protein J422_03738 [Methanocaldococcus villosus KIN24-T80]
MKADIILKDKDKFVTSNQILLLLALYKTKSQNSAAKLLNISPSSFNIQLKRLEKKLGFKLYYSSPNGTVLTEKAINLLEEYLIKKSRLESERFTVSGYISGELAKKLFDDPIITSFNNAIKLLKMDLVDILGLDDSYWLYRLEDDRFLKSEVGNKKIDIIHTYEDHFVMVYKEEFNYKNLIGIRYSPHRILYNILKSNNINFRVRIRVNNPFKAIELVNKGYSLFLNESLIKYAEGLNIEYPKFYEKTIHTITFIKLY